MQCIARQELAVHRQFVFQTTPFVKHLLRQILLVKWLPYECGLVGPDISAWNVRHRNNVSYIYQLLLHNTWEGVHLQ